MNQQVYLKSKLPKPPQAQYNNIQWSWSGALSPKPPQGLYPWTSHFRSWTPTLYPQLYNHYIPAFFLVLTIYSQLCYVTKANTPSNCLKIYQKKCPSGMVYNLDKVNPTASWTICIGNTTQTPHKHQSPDQQNTTQTPDPSA